MWGQNAFYIFAFLKNVMKSVKHANDQICAGYVDPDFDLRRHRAGVVLRTNGSAFSFGDPKTFGDSSGIDLTNIKQILCPRFTCVAVKADGSIAPWSEIERKNKTSSCWVKDAAALRWSFIPWLLFLVQGSKCVILSILGTRASWATCSRLGGRVWNLWNTALIRRPHWWPWPSTHHCLGWRQERWSDRLSQKVSPFIWCQEGLQPLRRLQEWCLHGRRRWGHASCLGRCSLWRFDPRGNQEIAKQAGRSRRDVLFVYTSYKTANHEFMNEFVDAWHWLRTPNQTSFRQCDFVAQTSPCASNQTATSTSTSTTTFTTSSETSDILGSCCNGGSSAFLLCSGDICTNMI